MKHLSSCIFDSYDDVNGSVLRELLPSVEQVPDFMKTASHINEETRKNLPDSNFALVLLDEGQKLKKYAMVDKGNTALSVMYLLKQANLLPPEAVKVAAGNLVEACEYFGLEAPALLKVAALTGQSSVSGKNQSPYARGAKVSKINFPYSDEPKKAKDNTVLGQTQGEDQDLNQRSNMEGTPGTNFLEIPIFKQKERVSVDPNGTEKKASASIGKLKTAVDRITRQQGFRSVPYVDVTGWDPRAFETAENPTPEHTLLGPKYPADTIPQIKMAMVYFSENKGDFSPRDRHEYCVKLAYRLKELGFNTPEDIDRYGSRTYASDVDAHLESRRGLIDPETLGPALDVLIEKRAMIPPEVFADALEDFDKLAGLNWVWGQHLADPYYSTFGPSFEKRAEDEWRYDDLGVRVSKQDLDSLIRNSREGLVASFGEKFVEAFSKQPVAFFTALPNPERLVLARMAQNKSQASSGSSNGI